MRFSLAILLPLAAAIMPALSGTINVRKADESVEARDYGTYAPWRPSWTWPGPDKHCPYDAPIDCPCLSNPTCGFECPHYWPEPGCTWDTVFDYTDSWKGWKPGKHDPFSCGYVDKENYEIDCKNLCSAHKDCHSCQVYTLEETADQYICALFEEIIEILTWEDYCEDDWVDGNKYYNTSYWNAHY
ncbi:hypothetical protein ARMGADRAFT_1015704 [Armillaria gallica]|uniref:Uncharacterized protein n=1 Tax=Armillaria gallica TaxID=47427 RepID=A0A2H3DNK4_ARMGA|nr:hypothetical protein ARMGADRAFT_1015704 [Armillaria gallica]